MLFDNVIPKKLFPPEAELKEKESYLIFAGIFKPLLSLRLLKLFFCANNGVFSTMYVRKKQKEETRISPTLISCNVSPNIKSSKKGISISYHFYF